MKSTQFVLLSFIVGAEVASEWSPLEFDSEVIPMVWVDGRFRGDDPAQIDTFFDRVVSIAYTNSNATGKKYSKEGTGVLLTKDLVLTSFNAFRNVSSEKDSLSKMDIYWLTVRKLDENGKTDKYDDDDMKKYTILCGRQVIPPIDYEARPTHMKHGPHSPLHDLMILRINEPAEFVTPEPPVTAFSDYTSWTLDNELYTKDEFGPIKTILAKPGDRLFRDEMKFASIGHINDKHIEENRYLEIGQFGDIGDCEEWIPREWGLFICLMNTENYPGLASGAVLFSGDKLFGIGAFMLQKGGSSILVFTDVRPYWHLFYRTCTDDDQNLQMPEDLNLNGTNTTTTTTEPSF